VVGYLNALGKEKRGQKFERYENKEGIRRYLAKKEREKFFFCKHMRILYGERQKPNDEKLCIRYYSTRWEKAKYIWIIKSFKQFEKN